jgi:hypothetical protein
MAKLGFEFNPSEVEPSSEPTLMEPHKALAQVVASEEKENSAQTGTFFELEVELLGGPHKGRKQWVMLNLNNPSKQAVDIARKELSAICRAVGFTAVLRDTSDLHFKPCIVSVAVEPERKDKTTGKVYRAKNKIAGWYPVEGSNVAATQRAQPQTQAGFQRPPADATVHPGAQPGVGGGAPWLRNKTPASRA